MCFPLALFTVSKNRISCLYSTSVCSTQLSRWNPPISTLMHKRSVSDSTGWSPHTLIHSAEGALHEVHEFTHLPWWAVIVLTTVSLRTVVTLPLAIHQNKIIAKMELLKPTIQEYQEAVKHNVIVKCRRANLPVEEANKIMMKEVHRLLSIYCNCA